MPFDYSIASQIVLAFMQIIFNCKFWLGPNNIKLDIPNLNYRNSCQTKIVGFFHKPTDGLGFWGLFEHRRLHDKKLVIFAVALIYTILVTKIVALSAFMAKRTKNLMIITGTLQVLSLTVNIGIMAIYCELVTHHNKMTHYTKCKVSYLSYFVSWVMCMIAVNLIEIMMFILSHFKRFHPIKVEEYDQKNTASDKMKGAKCQTDAKEPIVVVELTN
ncbi:hypothetical protein RF11_10683 [Thelohanellus kitauei]|uniref:Uncharacterized protein n=1 Tax=Thelohanellus kitauei TaxID=669202 RepID=A0A0C2IVC3_THEKT|nr:hypothetical protein RF11_10683 [Thelohanellus kitauei]